MNGISVVVTGNVGNNPVLRKSSTGETEFLTFSVGVTPRRVDRTTGEFHDEPTTWVDVCAFRALAQHASRSLRKGDPVIVSGQLSVKAWEREGRTGTSVSVVARSIGPNLQYGDAMFRRAPRVAAPDTEAAGRIDVVGGDEDDVLDAAPLVASLHEVASSDSPLSQEFVA